MFKSWDFNASSEVLSPPVVVQDIDKCKIIFGTKDGKIYQLNEDSSIDWTFETKEIVDDTELFFLDTDNMNSISSTPNVVDINGDGEKEILFGSELGFVYCINMKGTKLWKYKTSGAIRSSPALADINHDGKLEVIVGCTDGYIYVLSSEGQLITKFEVGSPIYATPSFFMDKLFVGTKSGDVVTFDVKTENRLWKFHTKDQITSRVVPADLLGDNSITLLVTSNDNTLYALSLEGEVIWTFRTEGSLLSEVAIHDINNDKQKEILFGSCDNSIYCVSPFGELIWKYETDFWIASTPLVADIDNDGRIEVVAGSYDHNLYILDSQGTYMLNYMPGLSGIVNQSGHYSSAPSKEVGHNRGKKLWQIETDGIIVGCALVNNKGDVVVNTKKGMIQNIAFN